MLGEIVLSASLMMGSPSVDVKAPSVVKGIKKCVPAVSFLFKKDVAPKSIPFSIVDNPKLFSDSLKCGLINLKYKDPEGRSLLHHIAMRGNVSQLEQVYSHLMESVDQSPQKKNPLDITDKHGRTPFFYAMMSKNWEVAKKLVEFGVDFNYTDNKYTTPVTYALKYDNFDMVKFMVDHGASFTGGDDKHRSLLVYPILHRRMDILKYVVENAKRIDLSYLDDNYWSPVMYATRFKNYEALEYLLQKGSDPNYREKKYYRSPLIWAIIDNDRMAIEILLKYGASPKEADSRGRNAFWYAKRHGVPLNEILRSVRGK